MKIDYTMVSALVKQWYQETRTFHLLVGEATIMLQDVAVLKDLRIDGRVVTSHSRHVERATCYEPLGLMPDDHSLKGFGLRLRWLQSTLEGSRPLSDTIDDVVG